MSDRERVNISIRHSIQAKAAELMRLRDIDNFSEFLATLIREEHERRQGPATFQEPPTPYRAGTSGAKGNKGTPRKLPGRTN